MPNYVSSYIKFENMNQQASEKYNLLRQRLSKDNYFSDLMNDGSIPSDEIYTRAWQYEYVGPKWTTIEDIHECGMTLTSAWSAPTIGVEWLINELSQIQDDLITVYTYEEECPDFYGIYIYKGNVIYDGYERDSEDIEYEVEDKIPVLATMREDDSYTDEGMELFSEHVWDVINAEQESFITETLLEINK